MFPPLWLSPTTLNMVSDCPRCLYDHVVFKQKRPSGPFPSLPGGVDTIMKNFCDRYRGTLPPILKALIPQVPELEEFVLHQDQRLMNSWRDWKGGLIYNLTIGEQKYKISGSIDDLLVRLSDGAMAVVDYKSKAKKPEAGEGARYYQSQLDTYDLIFRRSGFEMVDMAFLWYVTPISFDAGDMAVPSAVLTFDNTVQQVSVSADRAMERIQAFHEILMAHPDRSKPPASGDRCDYCAWAGRH